MRHFAAVLFFGLLASPLYAQDPASTANSRGGCGLSEVQYDVTTSKDHPAPRPEGGKALVYVIEDIERGPTMLVGVDGAWVGANKGKSYIFFPVDPGDHQVCTRWQSSVFKKTAERIGSAAAVKAEAGKAYYFRIQVYERSEHDRSVKLEPVEAPEGEFLVSSSKFSTSRPKK